MARSKYGPQAGSRRSAVVDPARPSGLLLHVLLDYWASVPPELQDALPMEAAAAVGHGFHARPGMGCDMTVDERTRGSVTTTRCGDRPCAWFAYQLKVGGVILGVRACTEHHNSAIYENLWNRVQAKAEDFFVWEVMTC